jgi:DNA-binding NarL/FixJ family response regulator
VSIRRVLCSPRRPGRILLADEHVMLRGGLARMIEREPDLQIVGETGSAQEALQLLARTTPDLALVDVGFKDGGVLELVRRMRRASLGLPILLLTVRDDARLVERALRAGARGSVSKWARAEAFAGTIRRVLAGEMHLPALGGPGGDATPEDAAAFGATRPLTAREVEVLRQLGQGLDSEEIADQFGLSYKTVEVYFSNIRRKLGLTGPIELHRYAHARFGHAHDS